MIEAHIQDKIQRALWEWEEEVTDFMPYSHANQVIEALMQTDLFYTVWGGYEEAERVRIGFRQMSAPSPDDFPICLISFSGNEKFLKGSHRDWLGALMGLGITREKVGDILVRKDGADVFVDEILVDYILQQDLKIKRVPVKGERVAVENWQKPEIKKKELTLIVNSPRVDAIIAKGYGIDRKRAATLIEKEQVEINHLTVTKPAQEVTAEDLISVRGFGRLRVKDFLGKTKKDKYKIHIWRYL